MSRGVTAAKISASQSSEIAPTDSKEFARAVAIDSPCLSGSQVALQVEVRCTFHLPRYGKRFQGSHGAGILVRNPRPLIEMESLRPYLPRVTECNGFDTPWALYSRAGLNQHEFRGTRLRIEPLATICNCGADELRAIGYAESDGRRHAQLLGWRIPSNEFDFAKARFCPECVIGTGIIEGVWDLKLMTGCPVHNQVALSSCPTCRAPLNWYRPGLLICCCGAHLTLANRISLAPEVRELLAIIRSRTLRLLSFRDDAVGFPAELYGLVPQHVLSLMHTLGSCAPDLKVPHVVSGNSAEQVTCAAAHVLSDWPLQFFALLAKLQHRPEPVPYDVRRQFAPIYNAILKRNRARDGDEYNFLRRSFIEFIANHQNNRAGDPRLMKGIVAIEQPRYVTRAALARTSNIDPRVLTRFVHVESASAKRRPFKTVLDSRSFAANTTGNGKVLSTRDAARLLHCPTSLVKALKRTNLITDSRLIRGKPGHLESDLLALQDRLLDAARTSAPPEVGERSGILLISVMCAKRYSLETRVAIIGRVLSRDLPVWLSGTGSLEVIMVSDDACREIARSQRANAEFLGAIDAKSLLGVDFDAVVALIELGHLSAVKLAGKWHINSESVRVLHDGYRDLSQIAKDLATSARRLYTIVLQENLHVLITRKGTRRRRILLRRSDEPVLHRQHYAECAKAPPLEQIVNTIVCYIATEIPSKKSCSAFIAASRSATMTQAASKSAVHIAIEAPLGAG